RDERLIQGGQECRVRRMEEPGVEPVVAKTPIRVLAQGGLAVRGGLLRTDRAEVAEGDAIEQEFILVAVELTGPCVTVMKRDAHGQLGEPATERIQDRAGEPALGPDRARVSLVCLGRARVEDTVEKLT